MKQDFLHSKLSLILEQTSFTIASAFKYARFRHIRYQSTQSNTQSDQYCRCVVVGRALVEADFVRVVVVVVVRCEPVRAIGVRAMTTFVVGAGVRVVCVLVLVCVCVCVVGLALTETDTG